MTIAQNRFFSFHFLRQFQPQNHDPVTLTANGLEPASLYDFYEPQQETFWLCLDGITFLGEAHRFWGSPKNESGPVID